MNGLATTGTIHAAHDDTRRGVQYLVADCGMARTQNYALAVTDEPVTCRRCLARTAQPAPAARPRPARQARTTAGPVTWGVYNAQGDLSTWRSTRREALTAAGRMGAGYTVAKLPTAN
jgi:hypothetical protein